MAPILHLVRHAQGLHNLSLESQSLPDPDLTSLGKEQCAVLRETFPAHHKITNLVASPLRRTLYTCLLSFAPKVAAGGPGAKIIALPDAQEISLYGCDIGSDIEPLKAEFGDQEVDFSLVPSGWNDKSPESKYYPAPEKLMARALNVRLWLRTLARGAGHDAQIVLVTHGEILHFITEEWDDIDPSQGTGWKNTELRSYQFVDLSDQDANASLRETDASWQQRRGSEARLTAGEQSKHREAYCEEIVKQTKQLEEERSRSNVASS